jgi:ribosome-binding factor A
VTGPVKRATKVAGRLREAMVAALRELSDPRTQGVLVTRVEVTDDLQSAKIYVRRELGVTEETEPRTACAARSRDPSIFATRPRFASSTTRRPT